MSAIRREHRFGPKARAFAKDIKHYAVIVGIITAFAFILAVNAKDLPFCKYTGIGLVGAAAVGTLAYKVQYARKKAIPVEPNDVGNL